MDDAPVSSSNPGTLEEDEFLAALGVGLAQADRGEFIEEDEMDARVRKLLGS